jgi:SAM-dependent methyltransferase
MEEYSELSINLTKSLSKKTKKDNGIFFTPNSIVKDLTDKVFSFFPINTNLNILEPSCGSLAFIKYIDTLVSNNYKIIGVEKNPDIVETYNEQEFNNDIELYQMDFLEYPNELFDIIIGNPPYFVMKSEEIPEKYKDTMIGRPNIFGLFIVKCLEMLKPNGILAFILPNSFLNSNYYSKIRELIITKYNLEIIKEYTNDQFLETEQGTIGIIISNKPSTNSNYYINFNGIIVFTPNKTRLEQLLEGTTTLKKMGCKVKTGTIVWNQVKNLLTDDQSKTLLIYNSNLNNGELELKNFKNDEKKQYIDKEGKNEPILVVNRGHGNSTYKLDWLFIDGSYKYLIENHLNMIQVPNKSNEERNIIIEKIITSYQNPNTQEFIDIFLGNNGLSKTELEDIFPIYL